MSDPETPAEKLMRRSKENPIVPVGIACALGACGYAAWNFKNRGNTKRKQIKLLTDCFLKIHRDINKQ